MGTTDIVITWWKEQIILQSKCCGNLQNKVNKLIRLFRRKSRTTWCHNYINPYNKYSPINFNTAYRTIEFRFFNSCHDKRYVCKCIDWATDLWLYIMMVYNAHNLGSEVIFT